MEGLIELYGKTAAPVLEMGSSKNEEIDFTTMAFQNGAVEMKSMRTQNWEDVIDTVDSCSAEKAPNTCLIIITMMTTKNSYSFDIKQDNDTYLLESFGLSAYAKYAFSTSMALDVIPRMQGSKST